MAESNGNGRPVTWAGIRAWLPLVVTLVALAVNVGVVVQNITYMDARLCKVESKQETYDAMSTKLQVQLAEIQRDVAWLRSQWERQTP